MSNKPLTDYQRELMAPLAGFSQLSVKEAVLLLYPGQEADFEQSLATFKTQMAAAAACQAFVSCLHDLEKEPTSYFGRIKNFLYKLARSVSNFLRSDSV